MANRQKTFSNLAYKNEKELLFGSSLYPVKCGFEVEIGNGLVIPEVNFTLPTMEISEKNKVVPGGDTDCAHSNTAMRLAFMQYIPCTFAALVRAMGAARSLVAFECGAIGPHKDCGYEGPIIKAITGMPISMEGKSSACAHASHMGNVASAVCDLWSNESVQHVRLLGGFTPEVFAEVLLYDCRLMNEAIKSNRALVLRDMMVESDVKTSPEALVIAPASAFKIAQSIVNHRGYYTRSLQAALTASEIIRDAIKERKLILPERELKWLDKFARELEECPDEEDKFIWTMSKKYQGLFIPEEYGLKV